MAEGTLAPAAPAALIKKLDERLGRYTELENLLNDPAVLGNSQRLVSISKEKGQLEPIVDKYRQYRKAVETAGELRQMAENKADADMAELAATELPDAQAKAS